MGKSKRIRNARKRRKQSKRSRPNLLRLNDEKKRKTLRNVLRMLRERDAKRRMQSELPRLQMLSSQLQLLEHGVHPLRKSKRLNKKLPRRPRRPRSLLNRKLKGKNAKREKKLMLIAKQQRKRSVNKLQKHSALLRPRLPKKQRNGELRRMQRLARK